MLSVEDVVTHGISSGVLGRVWIIKVGTRHHRRIGWERCSYRNAGSQKKASYGGMGRGPTTSVAFASTVKSTREMMADSCDKQAAITAKHNMSKGSDAKSGEKRSLKMDESIHEADECEREEATSEKWQRAKKPMGKSLHQFERKKCENTNLKVQSVLKSLVLKMGMQQSQEERAGESLPPSEIRKETKSVLTTIDQADNGIETLSFDSLEKVVSTGIETLTFDSSEKVISTFSGRQGVLQGMGEDHSLSESQPSVMVEDIFGALARARNSQEMATLMEGWECKVTMPVMKLILAELVKRKHWAIAWKLFDWIHEHAEYEPDATVYELMLLLLPKAKKTDIAKLLLQMKRQGMLPGVIEYTSRIVGYVKSGDLKEGLLTLDNMRKLGIKPTVSTYNILIDGCVSDFKELELVNGLLGMMKKDRIVPNTHTYASLIMLYNRKERYAAVVNTFLEARSKGCNLDKAASNTVLHSYSKLRDANGMLEAYEWMSHQGVEQDIATYNIIFHALAHNGQMQDLPLHYSKMRKNLLIPDVATFSILITAYGKAKDWLAVDTLLHDMKSVAVRPDLTFWNTLITVYGKAGLWDDMELISEFLKDKQRKGVAMNIGIYNSLLNLYGKEGNLEDTMKWFTEMKSKGVTADMNTYNALVTAYSRSYHFDGVEEVLECLQQDGLQPEFTFYQSSLSMLVRAGQYAYAWKIISDMKRKGCLKTADAYNSLMTILGRGSIHETRKLFQHMIKNKIHPNPLSYKAMIDIYGHKGLLEECDRIFQESIRYFGKDPFILSSILNVYCNLRCMEKAEALLQGWEGKTTAQSLMSYNSLIRGYGRTGEWAKAEEVVKRMKAEKVEPTMQTYVLLLDVYAKVGQIQKGEDLIAFIQKENLLGSLIVYNAFLNFYLKHNKVKDAIAIYDDLRTKGPKPDHSTYAIMVHAYLEDGLLHEKFVEFVQDLDQPRLTHKTGCFRSILAMIPKCRKHEDAMVLFSALEQLGCPTEILDLFKNSDDPTPDGTSPLWKRLDGILSLMSREGVNIDVQRGFHNVLIDALWSFGSEVKALKLMNISLGMGVYGSVCHWDAEEWCLDLHLASVGAAMLLLFTWIMFLRQAVLGGLALPYRVKIILAKDWQMRTGENLLIRQAVHAQLKDIQAPFSYTEGDCILEADLHDLSIWLSKSTLSKLLFLTR